MSELNQSSIPMEVLKVVLFELKRLLGVKGVFECMHFEGVLPLCHVLTDAALELRFHTALKSFVIVEGGRVFVPFPTLVTSKPQSVHI